MYSYGAERRALEQLRPDEQVAVYEEALKEFEALCAPPGPGLVETCRKRARYLRYFPECGPRCRELIRSSSDVGSSGSRKLGRDVLAACFAASPEILDPLREILGPLASILDPLG
jgi:hypothetical protein